MPEALGILVLVVIVAAGVWLAINGQQQLRQLRAELDQTQRQLNETRATLREVQQQVNELKAAAEFVPPPPRLPRSPASGLDDLREQLRAAHHEADDAGTDE
jgi:septal ring factor EnvC (AmiA/AmiB activator)